MQQAPHSKVEHETGDLVGVRAFARGSPSLLQKVCVLAHLFWNTSAMPENFRRRRGEELIP